MGWQLIGNIAGRPGNDGRDGKDAVAPDVDAIVARAVALVPAGRDGKDFDASELRSELELLKLQNQSLSIEIADLKAERAGLAASIDRAMRAAVASEVAKAIAAVPVPKNGVDGRSPTADDIAPLVKAEVDRVAATLPKAKDGVDGVSVVGTLIDRAGHLVLTLSNGHAVDVGQVVGADGHDVDMDAVQRQIADAMALIPTPKDGKDGRDGVGWTDMDEVLEDDGRVLVHRYFHEGKVVKEFRHQTSMLIWRGVYQPGATYQRGDTATWAGSLWHCNDTTTAQPGQTKSWTQMTKKGSDGKQGPAGPPGPQGPRGEQGPQGPRIY